MQKENYKTTFIVTTSSAQGAWYPEKRSTLSLINSHVANRKAQQADKRRSQLGGVGRRTRARKNPPLPSVNPTVDSLYAHNEQDATAHDEPLEDATSWSLNELYDIFGNEDNNDLAREVSKTEPTHQSAIPSQSSTHTWITYGEAHHGPGRQHDMPADRTFGLLALDSKPNVLAKGTQDEALRLPDRVETLSLADNSFRRNTDKSHQPHTQTKYAYNSYPIFRQIETILDPFLRLAIKVSTAEQQLLQFCKSQHERPVFAYPTYG